MNNFKNKAQEKLWNLIAFQENNNIKTPLGIISLFVNVDPEIELENKIDKNTGMEF